MPGISVDPDKLRAEGRRWFTFADEMTKIRRNTADLWLGIMAFFPGGLGTEAGHYRKYDECLDMITHRLEGAAIEFELIGTTLNNIATSYEEGERVTAESFRITAEELERATEAHAPPPPGGRWHEPV
jgi:hypothetical protein